MKNIEELKKGINYWETERRCPEPWIKEFIECAKSVISASESFPKKVNISPCPGVNEGFWVDRINSKIDACTLSVAKNYVAKKDLPERGEIIRIVRECLEEELTEMEWLKEGTELIGNKIHDRILKG